MTTIETDNPIIKWWVEYYDIIWKYWPIVLALLLCYCAILFVRHRKARRKLDELNRQRNEKTEELRKAYKQMKDPRKAFLEDDVIEIDHIEKVKPLVNPNP